MKKQYILNIAIIMIWTATLIMSGVFLLMFFLDIIIENSFLGIKYLERWKLITLLISQIILFTTSLGVLIFYKINTKAKEKIGNVENQHELSELVDDGVNDESLLDDEGKPLSQQQYENYLKLIIFYAKLKNKPYEEMLETDLKHEFKLYLTEKLKSAKSKYKPYEEIKEKDLKSEFKLFLNEKIEFAKSKYEPYKEIKDKEIQQEIQSEFQVFLDEKTDQKPQVVFENNEVIAEEKTNEFGDNDLKLQFKEFLKELLDEATAEKASKQVQKEDEFLNDFKNYVINEPRGSEENNTIQFEEKPTDSFVIDEIAEPEVLEKPEEVVETEPVKPKKEPKSSRDDEAINSVKNLIKNYRKNRPFNADDHDLKRDYQWDQMWKSDLGNPKIIESEKPKPQKDDGSKSAVKKRVTETKK